MVGLGYCALPYVDDHGASVIEAEGRRVRNWLSCVGKLQENTQTHRRGFEN
jgi:hypothetical protein